MPVVSLLVLAVLAQPVQHRVEVLGRGGEAFWSAGARGADLWERVRGEVQLDARRPSEGPASAALSLQVTRGAERWTIELTTLRSGSLMIDADLPGPGGLVHAAVVLGGTARVTRAGEVLSDAASLRALALTTGFHADDGTVSPPQLWEDRMDTITWRGKAAMQRVQIEHRLMPASEDSPARLLAAVGRLRRIVHARDRAQVFLGL